MSSDNPFTQAQVEALIDNQVLLSEYLKKGLAFDQHMSSLQFCVVVVPDDAAPYIHTAETAELAAEFIRGVPNSSGRVFVIQGLRWQVSKFPRRMFAPDMEKYVVIDKQAEPEFEDDGGGSIGRSILPPLPPIDTAEVPKKSATDLL